MKILGLLAGAALLLGAQSAYAVTIVNGGFDTPVTNSATFDTLGAGDTSLGWKVGGAGVDHIGGLWQPQNGTGSIDLSGSSGSAPHHGSISQLLTDFVVGQEYKITFYMSGNVGSNTAGPDIKSMFAGVYTDESLSLGSLWEGNGYDYNTDLQQNSNGTMKWVPFSLKFVAQQTSYYLAFADTSDPDSNSGAALDSVSIAATPIPPALLLFASALGGIGFLGYRRKKLEAAA